MPALTKQFPKMRFVSIGPVTTKTAVEGGLKIAAEAEVHTIPGLVEAILELQ
jgi:uroporphyrinogen III methyltransferase/synthase